MSRLKHGFSTNTKNTLTAAEAAADVALDAKDKIFLGNINVTLVDVDRVYPDLQNPRNLDINKEEILSGLNLKNSEYISLKKQIKSKKKLNELEQLEKLSSSIKKNGLLNAIVVYKEDTKLNIITGERRYLSCLLLGYESIPAKILNKKPNNFQLRVIQWAENSDREDLTAWDRLDNVRVIVDSYSAENHDLLSARKLADIINIGKSQAAKYLQLLKEPLESKLMSSIKQNKITSLKVAEFISSIQDNDLKSIILLAAESGSNLVDLQRRFQKLQEKGQGSQKNEDVKLKFLSPKKLETAKFIVRSLIENNLIKDHKEKFINIDWNNPLEINKAWEKLIYIVEAQLVET